MNQYCPITGETHCKCDGDQQLVDGLQVDVKASFRKLFTDHGIYDKLVAGAILDSSPDLDALLARIKQNAIDIGDQMKPLVGDKSGQMFTNLFLQHITAAGDTAKAIRDKNQKKLDKALKDQDRVCDKIALFLQKIDPQLLPYDVFKPILDQHADQMVRMALLHVNGDHAKEIVIFDQFINLLLKLSDMISAALLL